MVSKTPARSRTSRLFFKLNKIAHQESSSISPETVHDLRTTARRIETLLAAHELDDDGSNAKLARQLARLRRRAGKLRDIDVHIAALDSVRLENGVRDRTALQEHLAAMRNKSEGRLLRTLEKASAKGLAKRMRRAEKDLQAAPSGDSPPKNFTAEALRKFKELVDGYPQLTDKTLHNFRIECKRIRYLAEMSGETPEAERGVSALKSIQDAIGEWHDWLTLTEIANEVLPNGTSPLMAALRTQTKSKFNAAIRVTAEAKERLLALGSTAAAASEVPRREPTTSGSGGSRADVVSVGTGQSATLAA